MKDYILKGIKKENNLRLIACDLTMSVKKINKLQESSLVNSIMLSELLLSACLMSADFKDDQKITLIVNTIDNTLMAEANAKRHVRGFVASPYSDIEIGDNCFLTVIKDYGLKDMFSSKIEMKNKNIIENINDYLSKSEQIPAHVETQINFNKKGKIKKALATYLSVFPDYTKEDIEVFSFYKDNIDKLGELIEILDTEEARFKCSCNKTKFKKGIASLPKKEIQKMIDEDKQCETICNFCLKKYVFLEDDLNKLINKK